LGGGTGGIIAFLVGLTVKTHSKRVLTGASSLVGETAEVSEELAPRGMVFFEGTNWSAVLTDNEGRVLEHDRIPKGEVVRVRMVHGLKVQVTRLGTGIDA
jgi:membrane-bound ClpP family serine protease